MDLRHLLCLGLAPLLLCTCADDLSQSSPGSKEPAATRGAVPPESQTAPAPPLSQNDLFADGKLSLHQSLRFGLQENLDIQVAEVTTDAVGAGVDIARAEFDPAIYAQAGREWLIEGDRYDAAEAGIQKKFLPGTVVSLEGNYTSDRFVNSSFDSDFPNGFTAAQPGGLSRDSDLESFVDSFSDEDVTLRVRQPLLRGAGVKVNRAGIDLARLDVNAADIGVRAQVLEFLRGAETGYWASAVAREIYLHEEASLARSRRILDDAKQRLEVGSSSILDLLEAEAGFATAQETTLRARRRYEDALDNLWFILGIPLDDRNPEIYFESVTKNMPTGRKPNPEDSYQQALTSFPSVLLLANAIRQDQVRLGVAKNNLLPGLDVEVSGRWRSKDDLRPNEIERDYDWGVLLQLSIPWTFRAERAEVRRVEAELTGSEISRENARRALKRDILAACRAIEVSEKQLDVAIQGAIVNEKKFTEQELRFQEGLVSTRDLIEDQERSKVAQTRELEARLRLIAAWKFLEQLDGSILRQRGFTWH